MALGDVKAVLQYVPLFRGRLFVVVFDEGLLPDPAVAETLLDLHALQQIGVRLVIGVLGGEVEVLADRATELELKFDRCAGRPGESDCVSSCQEILDRGQAVLVDCRGRKSFDADLYGVANELGAAKMITLVNGSGVLREGVPLHAVAVGEASRLATAEAVEGAVLLSGAAAACGAGIPRVHVLDGRRQGALTDELFSNEGVGTMVHTDAYQEIRKLREEDIPELLAMVGRSVRAAHLVPRDYASVGEKAEDFLVLCLDENVVGCVAVHRYGECGEVACLYVKQAHEGLGYGQELVQAAEQKAQEDGVKRLFTLTNRAFTFFEKLGYVQVGAEILPQERREKLEASGRESVVLMKG